MTVKMRLSWWFSSIQFSRFVLDALVVNASSDAASEIQLELINGIHVLNSKATKYYRLRVIANFI